VRVASVTEAKNRLSALLDLAQAGETVVIVDRGRPIAKLQSLRGDIADTSGRLARLARAGVVEAGTGELLPAILEPPPEPVGGASALDHLLRERETGR
jgi:prevent-host-death family protein